MTNRSAFGLVLLMCCLLPLSVQAEQTMVLVTDAACPIQEIDTLDIRKAYLGVVVTRNGRIIRPLRLNNDALLKQVFLQSVVAMSEKSYERRLLSLALKYGTPRPVEYDSVGKLVRAVKERSCSIAYLWKKDADLHERIKVLRLLWQGD